MDNHGIARCLREIADILETKGENGFRVRSYSMAADSVEASGQDLESSVARGEDVKDLPGIGVSMEQKIREIVETGSCAYHRDLMQDFPAGLLDLLNVSGLGHRGVAL